MQKNVEVQEKTIQTYKQELSTLLAYVNSVHSSSEEVFEDANEDYEERLKEWAEKKVQLKMHSGCAIRTIQN